MAGNSYSTPICLSIPAAIPLSTGLTDDPCTRTRTSFGPSVGAGRSSRSTGGVSNAVIVTAFIERPPGRRRGGVGEPSGVPEARLREGTYASHRVYPGLRGAIPVRHLKMDGCRPPRLRYDEPRERTRPVHPRDSAAEPVSG